MTVREAYRVLELENPSSLHDVKSRLRKLAKKHHPDVCKDKDATEKFQEIYDAYEIILRSMGESTSTIETDFADDLAWFFRRRQQPISAEMDPFETLHGSYFTPRIARILENLNKRRKTKSK